MRHTVLQHALYFWTVFNICILTLLGHVYYVPCHYCFLLSNTSVKTAEKFRNMQQDYHIFVLLYLIIVKLSEYILWIALLQVNWIMCNNCNICQIQILFSEGNKNLRLKKTLSLILSRDMPTITAKVTKFNVMTIMIFVESKSCG